jgi:uncharacterized protein YukJ
MPLSRYGVLKGRVTQQLAGQGNAPHHQLRLIDAVADYRAAINVRSALAPSELMFAIIDDLQHPLTEPLQRLPMGFTELEPRPGGMALDYIRGNLLGARRLKVLPYAEVGPANDLYDQLDALVQRVMGDGGASNVRVRRAVVGGAPEGQVHGVLSRGGDPQCPHEPGQ